MRPARKKEKKTAAATAPTPAPPEFEIASVDIYDSISRLDIPVKAKQQLSALVALAESGAVFDIDISVRAR